MKKQKKGVALIEAIIAGGILGITLLFSAYLISALSSTRERSLEAINLANITRVQAHIEYMKAKLEEQGKTSNLLRQNLIYAGWDTLSITPNGQSINDLNGVYLFEVSSAVCNPADVSDNSYPACLRQITNPDEWWAFFIGWEYRRYEENAQGVLLDPIETARGGLGGASMCAEVSSYCFLYRIHISNVQDTNYETISYREASGNLREVQPQKFIRIEVMTQETGEPDGYTIDFNYILSL